MAENFDKIIEKIEKFNTIQRIAICAGIILLISGAYFYLVIMPKFDMVSTLREEEKELDEQLDNVKEKTKDLKKIRNMAKHAEEQFEKARRILPDKEEIRTLLESVSRAGREAGLECTLFKPEQESIKDFYAEIPITIQLNGHFHNIAVFFDKVSRLSRIVNIQNFKIDIVEKNDKSLLAVACTAITYKFLEAGSHGKKKRK